MVYRHCPGTVQRPTRTPAYETPDYSRVALILRCAISSVPFVPLPSPSLMAPSLILGQAAALNIRISHLCRAPSILVAPRLTALDGTQRQAGARPLRSETPHEDRPQGPRGGR